MTPLLLKKKKLTLLLSFFVICVIYNIFFINSAFAADTTPPTVTFPTIMENFELDFTLKDNDSGVKYFAVSRSNSVVPTQRGTGSVTAGTNLDYWYMVRVNTSVNVHFSFLEPGQYYFWVEDAEGSKAAYSFQIILRNLANSYINMNVTSDFTYNGDAQKATVRITDTGKSNYVLQEYIDYTLVYSNNTDAGTASVKAVGRGLYTGELTKTYPIKKRNLYVTPDPNQSKFAGVNDPVITYTYSNNVVPEIPRFTGELKRENYNTQEAVGMYRITRGTLNIADNTSQYFKANNYELVFDDSVLFEISEFDALVLKWKVPVRGTIKIPNVGFSLDDYVVSWGDGTYNEYTDESFPSHTYTNTSVQEYTVRIKGKIKNFGYYGEETPTAGNIFKDYYSFTNGVTEIVSFGDIKAEHLGFSHCSNITKALPTASGFSTLTSLDNMFRDCTGIPGGIPEQFFATCANAKSANYTFYRCTGLTQPISVTVFQYCSSIKSMDSTFEECINITGNIPERLFEYCGQLISLEKTFKNCKKINTELQERLFINNTKVQSFRQMFEGCSGIWAINKDLFANNTVAMNYYRTFAGCTSLSDVPKELFSNNVVFEISNRDTSIKDYRETFANCTRLSLLDLDVHYIGRGMFRDCTNISQVNLPNTVVIGNEAFYNDNKLVTILAGEELLQEVGKDAFQYLGTNPAKLLTITNRNSYVLVNYDWDDDNRLVDVTPPKGTVEIQTPRYPYTNTQNVVLKITVSDDFSSSDKCGISIVNEVDYNPNVDPETLRWEPFVPNKDWVLTPNDAIKTVYVYFRDEVGNVSHNKIGVSFNSYYDPNGNTMN